MTDEEGGLYSVVLRKRALEQYGRPYVWGGASPVPGFDCSGLVYYVMLPGYPGIQRFTADVFLDAVMRIVKVPFRIRPGGLIFMFDNPKGVSVGFKEWTINDVTHMGLVADYNILHSIDFRGESGVRVSRDSILRNVDGYSTVSIDLTALEWAALVYELSK